MVNLIPNRLLQHEIEPNLITTRDQVLIGETRGKEVDMEISLCFANNLGSIGKAA